jgi:hypothetical protein
VPSYTVAARIQETHKKIIKKASAVIKTLYNS